MRVDDRHLGARIGIDARHAVLARRRIGDEGDVPVRLDQRRGVAALQVIGPGLVELAVLVGGIDQRRTVRREGIDAVGNIAFMLGDDTRLGFARLEVKKEDVAVSRGAVAHQRDPAAIPADIADL